MKTAPSLLAVLAAAALSACTTELDARRIIGKVESPVAGAPYNLPYTRFKLNVIRRVVSCASPIEIKVQVTAVPEPRRDPMRSYVIDLQSLQSFFKSTDVQVAYYDTGAIKSINAGADDQTGEFIASTAATVAKLVGAGNLRTALPTACTKQTAAALKNLVGKEVMLKAGTANADILTRELKAQVALVAWMGRSTPLADRREVTRLMRDLIDVQKKNQALALEIETHLADVSVKDDTFWPDDGETFISLTPVVKPVDNITIEKWIGDVPAKASVQAGTALYLELKATEQIGRAAPCGARCKEDTYAGLKYRLPAEGTLSMCASVVPPEGNNPAVCKSPATVTEAVMVNQLGRMLTLPLQSRVFSKKTVAATFNEAGVPTLLGVTSTAAAGKAAAAIGGLADSAVSIMTSRAGREAADLENRIKVLKLNKELEVATQALVPQTKDAKAEATQAFTVDTALKQAELSNLEVSNALEEAKRVSAPQ